MAATPRAEVNPRSSNSRYCLRAAGVIWRTSRPNMDDDDNAIDLVPATTMPLSADPPARLNRSGLILASHIYNRDRLEPPARLLFGALMTNPPFTLVPPSHMDLAAIEALLDLAFGLDRHTKTSYRLREGNCAAEGLAF